MFFIAFGLHFGDHARHAQAMLSFLADAGQKIFARAENRGIFNLLRGSTNVTSMTIGIMPVS